MRKRSARGCLAALLTMLVVGVAPAGAQVTPDPEAVLDHFRCYQPSVIGNPIGPVGLEDQFGPDSIQSAFPFELCTPMVKFDSEGNPGPPLVNLDAHLVCYIHDPGPFQPFEVEVTNQFGVDRLRVLRPERLCTPASKGLGTPESPPEPPPLGDIEQRLDHFRCYAASGAAVPPTVLLEDQFGGQQAALAPASLLCNPVEKQRPGFPPVRPGRPFAHLVCYPVSAEPLGITFIAATTDQFGTARWFLSPETGVFGELCVPSLKELVAPPARVPQHFRAYRAVGLRATRELMTLVDQFGAEQVRLGSVRLLMTPVEKRRSGRQPEPIQRPNEHLKCYGIVGATANRTVRVSNQFTDATRVTVLDPSHLCAPAAKTREGDPGEPPADLNHYKCYTVSRSPAVNETIGLSDQFGPDEQVLVRRLIRLCNPVEKRREGREPEPPPHPNEHLACYRVDEPLPFQEPTVFTRDQFRDRETLRVTRPSTLCVPSRKREELGEG
jgi:hypothetical protein